MQQNSKPEFEPGRFCDAVGERFTYANWQFFHNFFLIKFAHSFAGLVLLEVLDELLGECKARCNRKSATNDLHLLPLSLLKLRLVESSLYCCLADFFLQELIAGEADQDLFRIKLWSWSCCLDIVFNTSWRLILRESKVLALAMLVNKSTRKVLPSWDPPSWALKLKL